MSQQPKRIKCRKCGSTELQPQMHTTHVGTLVVPIWYCPACDYNSSSTILSEINKFHWQVYTDYEKLTSDALKEPQ